MVERGHDCNCCTIMAEVQHRGCLPTHPLSCTHTSLHAVKGDVHYTWQTTACYVLAVDRRTCRGVGHQLQRRKDRCSRCQESHEQSDLWCQILHCFPPVAHSVGWSLIWPQISRERQPTWPHPTELQPLTINHNALAYTRTCLLHHIILNFLMGEKCNSRVSLTSLINSKKLRNVISYTTVLFCVLLCGFVAFVIYAYFLI